MRQSDFQLPLESITSYLEFNGWRATNENDHWYLFEGFQDIDGQPFEIAIFKNTSAPDYALSVSHSLRTVSALSDKPIETVSQEILTFDRDILEVQVDDYANTTSIPIELAALQINELKQLVLYGATSERSQRQHYDTWLPSARATLDEFSFGHTVAGSFSFRLEAKLTGHQTRDRPVMAGFEPKPMSRIVMERIMRGLAATEEAVSENGTRPLVNGYKAGFNSNMCEAIAKISQDNERPVQYRIKWSRVFDVSNDLIDVRHVEIHGVHRHLLERASKELAFRESTFATVEGSVRSLDSKDDPRSDDAEGRAVIIRGGIRGGRQRQIHLTLEKDDYLTAIRAHDEWRTVSVSGYLSKIGAKWVLQEPESFRIIR